jgi:hypothetical protein
MAAGQLHHLTSDEIQTIDQVGGYNYAQGTPLLYVNGVFGLPVTWFPQFIPKLSHSVHFCQHVHYVHYYTIQIQVQKQ